MVWGLAFFFYCLMHGTIAIDNILISTPCMFRVLGVFYCVDRMRAGTGSMVPQMVMCGAINMKGPQYIIFFKKKRYGHFLYQLICWYCTNKSNCFGPFLLRTCMISD